MCYELAKQNLRLNLDVIADTVNPITITRQAWRNVAESLEIPFDEHEHRHRIHTRLTDIPGFTLPSWDEVKNRKYEVWDRERLIIDTAHQKVVESLRLLIELLGLKR